jgi:uncharacterized protein (DUF362 family)
MERREFIKRAAQAVALVVAAGETGLLIDSCKSGARETTHAIKPNFEVAVDHQYPAVALAKDSDHAAATAAALGAVGGIGRFVRRGERVLLKPNVAFNRTPGFAVNTNPKVVGEMVRQCKDAGAADIIVTDHSGSQSGRTFARSGIRAAVEANGGRIHVPTDDDFIEAALGGRFVTVWPVLKHVFEVDRLINMPIAKHHTMVLGTASMKNFYGLIGGDRPQLHAQIEQSIVDLAAYFRPTLTVVDATRVLVRNGPGGGSLDDVVVHDSVICATDQVAADARACEFLGHTAKDIGHVLLAAQQGLGEIDYRKAGYKEII